MLWITNHSKIARNTIQTAPAKGIEIIVKSSVLGVIKSLYKSKERKHNKNYKNRN